MTQDKDMDAKTSNRKNKAKNRYTGKKTSFKILEERKFALKDAGQVF
ncbi:MAG: hypothetical protein NC432_08430 [Roseburia sp.]|nr:hypothetical protein [Roseburia sp.]MCM1097990.1 hypothetical protein [Ruminococcus flavefaciens]